MLNLPFTLPVPSARRRRGSQRSMCSPFLATVTLAAAASVFAGPPATTPKAPEPLPAETEAVVETSLGSFTIKLLPELAPSHVRLFVKTAKAGGYNGTTFHRIIAGGIIQGGDPLSKDKSQSARYGTGGLGLLKAEFSSRPLTRGTVAAVRRPSSADSAGTQFFVCLADQPSLTGQYTVYGEVTSGLEVADRIGQTPVDGDRARDRVEMTVTVRKP
jgi:peptidyl-prolyl cis-trans isomerase B (cyclophilin B)